MKTLVLTGEEVGTMVNMLNALRDSKVISLDTFGDSYSKAVLYKIEPVSLVDNYKLTVIFA